jgi:hypothetical protein
MLFYVNQSHHQKLIIFLIQDNNLVKVIKCNQQDQRFLIKICGKSKENSHHKHF